MTMMNGQPDFEEDGEELYCDSCGEELLPDGSCPMCDDDEDDDYDFDDDEDEPNDMFLDSSSDRVECLVDLEDHLEDQC
jgi:hypothetical protein